MTYPEARRVLAVAAQQVRQGLPISDPDQFSRALAVVLDNQAPTV